MAKLGLNFGQKIRFSDEIADTVDISVCSFYTSFLYLVW